MSDWQPIETAPRDGRLVLVWEYYGCAFALWNDVYERWEDPERGWIEPAHWQPLPGRPEDLA